MALIPNTPEIPLIGLLANLGAAPDWKDKLRSGSFRGVAFKTKSHQYDSGRHDVGHEFPKRNESNTEDLGQRLPKFSLDLYVLGDDYFEQRDALMRALDEEGPGELIHPYLGTRQVQVGKYTLTETAEEGRIARFKVEFSNSGSQKFPVESVDAFQSVLDGVNAALDAATAAFETAFSVANAPARVAEAAASLSKNMADRVTRIAKIAGRSAQAVADISFAMRNLKANALDLVRTPSALAAQFKDAFAMLLEATDDLKNLSKIISEEASSFEPDAIVGPDTPTTAKLKGNQVALTNLFVSISVSTQAQAAIEGNYVSVDESVVIRDLLNKDLDSLLESLTDDDTFQEIKNIQVAANLGLPPQNVGEILTFIPGKTLPALVISQKLFGSIEKEDELIAQNNVRHPGFVPALTPVEVSASE